MSQKQKIKYLDKLLIEKSNFNILNFILHKEIRILYFIFIFYLIILVSLVKHRWLLKIFNSFSVVALFLLIISLFFGPYIKMIDTKMDKIIKKTNSLHSINWDEMKIEYALKYFLPNPLDLRKNLLKLENKIDKVFNNNLKEKFEFEKDKLQKQVEKEIEKILDNKASNFLIKNGLIVFMGTSIFSLLSKYYDKLIDLIIQ